MTIETQPEPDQAQQDDADRIKQKAFVLSAALRDLREEIELQREQQEQAGAQSSATPFAEAADKLGQMTADLEDVAIQLVGGFYHRDRQTQA